MALKIPSQQGLELWVLLTTLDVLGERVADHIAHGAPFDVGDRSSLIGQGAVDVRTDSTTQYRSRTSTKFPCPGTAMHRMA